MAGISNQHILESKNAQVFQPNIANSPERDKFLIGTVGGLSWNQRYADLGTLLQGGVMGMYDFGWFRFNDTTPTTYQIPHL